MNDLKTTTVITRIEGIKAAVGRSRLGFLVSTIISLSIILGVWNRYFAWDREYAMEKHWADATVFPVAQYLQQQLLSQWVQDQQISSSLFGIRVSASDATFLASCALLITMVWFYWCTRRENHSIGALLRDTCSENEDLKLLILHGIIANLVFIRFSDDDRSVSSLAPSSSPGRRLPLLRAAVKALIYFPAFTILCSGLVQLWFLNRPSPFDTHGDHWPHHSYRWAYVMFVSAVGIAGLVTASVAAYKINSFQKGMALILREYMSITATQSKSDNIKSGT